MPGRVSARSLGGGVGPGIASEQVRLIGDAHGRRRLVVGQLERRQLRGRQVADARTGLAGPVHDERHVRLMRARRVSGSFAFARLRAREIAVVLVVRFACGLRGRRAPLVPGFPIAAFVHPLPRSPCAFWRRPGTGKRDSGDHSEPKLYHGEPSVRASLRRAPAAANQSKASWRDSSRHGRRGEPRRITALPHESPGASRLNMGRSLRLCVPEKRCRQAGPKLILPTRRARVLCLTDT